MTPLFSWKEGDRMDSKLVALLISAGIAILRELTKNNDI